MKYLVMQLSSLSRLIRVPYQTRNVHVFLNTLFSYSPYLCSSQQQTKVKRHCLYETCKIVYLKVFLQRVFRLYSTEGNVFQKCVVKYRVPCFTYGIVTLLSLEFVVQVATLVGQSFSDSIIKHTEKDTVIN
jgi:hypothetical protein